MLFGKKHTKTIAFEKAYNGNFGKKYTMIALEKVYKNYINDQIFNH